MTYDTPNTVSALVVNTLKESPLSHLNSISPPVDLPIQLRCIALVFFRPVDCVETLEGVLRHNRLF